MKGKIMCRNSVIFIFILFFILSCLSKESTDIIEIGSDIDVSSGKIKNNSLLYNFQYKKRGTIQDFFDYVYFEGDIVAFSIDLKKEIPESAVKVLFSSKDKKIKFNAERIEIKDGTIWGFSLVGSILEKFYKDKKNLKMDNLEFPVKTEMLLIFEYREAENKVCLERTFEFILTN